MSDPVGLVIATVVVWFAVVLMGVLLGWALAELYYREKRKK